MINSGKSGHPDTFFPGNIGFQAWLGNPASISLRVKFTAENQGGL